MAEASRSAGRDGKTIGAFVVVLTEGPDPRRWWQRKRWWIVAIIAVSAIASNSHRTQAIERLRTEMRDRALNGPEPEPIPPCVVVANTGEVQCSKPRPLTPCRAKTFIDPFETWAGVRGEDALRAFTTRKFRELGGMEELAQWFACQGFNVSYEHNEIHAGVLTPGGYGPFSTFKLPWPPAWGDSADIGFRNGRLTMDIGTTYE